MRRISAMIAGAIALTAVELLGFSGPAAAATSGLQISLCASQRSQYGTAQVEGNNQNGTWTTSPRVKLSAGCTDLWGWWWRGDVIVKFWDTGGNMVSFGTNNIPAFSFDDWYTVRSGN